MSEAIQGRPRQLHSHAAPPLSRLRGEITHDGEINKPLNPIFSKKRQSMPIADKGEKSEKFFNGISEHVAHVLCRLGKKPVYPPPEKNRL